MRWYVFALVDAAPSRRPGRGLSGPLRVRGVPGGFAIVERRADVPPPEFGTLQRHQAIVVRVADAVPAIVPVRFGTLVDDAELEEALADRETEMSEAFSLVRHRVQFTWRCRPTRAVRGTPAVPVRAPWPDGRATPDASAATVRSGAGDGAAYLRRAAELANPVPPAAFEPVRRGMHTLVVREKFQPAGAGGPATLYQLIDKRLRRRYCVMAESLAVTSPGIVSSGPWPPFAFVPEVL